MKQNSMMSLGQSPEFTGIPEPLLQVLGRFQAETNDAQSLLLLIDCFELALKFIAALAIKSAWTRADTNADLKKKICENLQLPSLGHFAEFLRDCNQELKMQGERVWSLHLAAAAKHQSIDPMLALRNEYRGHGATLTSPAAGEQLKAHIPKLDSFLKALPGQNRLQLWCVLERPERHLLRASPVRPSEIVSEITVPVDAQIDAGHLILEDLATGQFLSLHPLVILDPSSRGEQRFLVFNGCKGSDIRFLNYGTGEHVRFSKGDKIQLDFEIAFPRPSREPSWFASLIEQTTQHFVGRQDALERLSSFAAAKDKRRALIVTGAPGMGKTTLLARWTQREPVLRHFLREADEVGCAPAAVFLNLARQAAKMYGLRLGKINPNDAESARSEFLSLLSAVRLDAAAPIIVIDGLDEAERVRTRRQERSSIVDWLPEPLQFPGNSRWILSARPENLQDPQFAVKFGEDRADVFELGRLRALEIRTLLRDRCNWRELERNPGAIEHILDRSEGLPLYLRMLIDELDSGRLTIGHLETIPRGVDAFFQRLLSSIQDTALVSDRSTVAAQVQQIRDTLARLGESGAISKERLAAFEREEYARIKELVGVSACEVMAILAVARAPLLIQDLASILSEAREPIERAFRVILNVVAEVAEGQWTIFHGAFRTFLVDRRPELLRAAEERLTT